MKKADIHKENLILEMKGISKIYGNGVYANKKVDFDLKYGEIHALVGENGAGKSTLMKILFGLERLDKGSITLNGKPVDFHSPQEAMAEGIGMVHQHFMLVDSFSIIENVALGYEPMARGLIDIKEAYNKVLEISKLFDIKIDLNTPTGTLPVGIKQKVEIIKALYRGAKILILDEPTAVLTPQETEELFKQLQNLKKQGFTVVFISHKLREVKAISDRISVMRKGELIDTVLTKDVSVEDISAMMVGRDYSSELNKTKAKPKKPILKVKQLVSYGINNKKVVDNVSFTVRAGEIVGIAGVEDNGQNELVAMITGLRKTDGGTISLLDEIVSNKSVLELRNQGLSYIPSDRIDMGLAVSMSIENNLITTKLNDKSLYRKKLLSNKSIRNKAKNLIEQYQIKCNSPSTEVSMLSGGNMQKVVVAREFTQESKLIIAEQPTRGVDVGAAKFIYEELIKLRDQGSAILLISADLEELYKLSDSLIVMYEGSVLAYIEDPSQVKEDELGQYMLAVKRQSEKEIEKAYYEE